MTEILVTLPLWLFYFLVASAVTGWIMFLFTRKVLSDFIMEQILMKVQE